MSELDNKMHEAMKDQFPWSEERPLSHKLKDIIAKSQERGASKADTLEECVRYTVIHIMPLIETTDLSCMYVTAALRVIADLTEKQLDDREKQIAMLLYLGTHAESTTITVNRPDENK